MWKSLSITSSTLNGVLYGRTGPRLTKPSFFTINIATKFMHADHQRNHHFQAFLEDLNHQIFFL
uniref:Uncharacterized protein n=1 Tax=Cannabis sativa TaxID=3483 RepID=A0A803R418_CANSA